jgi:hypothetical protein
MHQNEDIIQVSAPIEKPPHDDDPMFAPIVDILKKAWLDYYSTEKAIKISTNVFSPQQEMSYLHKRATEKDALAILSEINI